MSCDEDRLTFPPHTITIHSPLSRQKNVVCLASPKLATPEFAARAVLGHTQTRGCVMQQIRRKSIPEPLHL